MKTPTLSISLLLLQLFSSSSYAQTCNDGVNLDCPDGAFCTEWSDGCNDCSCDAENPTLPARCTLRLCECHNDNSCVPRCNENRCIPLDVIGDNGASLSTVIINGQAATPAPTSAPPTQAPTSSPPTLAPTPEPVPLDTQADNVLEEVTDLVEDASSTTTEEEETKNNAIPLVCPAGTTCKEWHDGCNKCWGDYVANFVAACSKKACPCQKDDSCIPKCEDNDQCVAATGGVSSVISSNSSQQRIANSAAVIMVGSLLAIAAAI